ncbi:hypothetical protein J8340_23295 [Escherichia coli]|nr:hypothetical protein [Escherichia coli]
MNKRITIVLFAFFLFSTLFSIPPAPVLQASTQIGCSCNNESLTQEEISSLNSNNEYFESLSQHETKQTLNRLNKFKEYKEVIRWFKTEEIHTKTRDIIGIKLNEFTHPITKDKYNNITQITYYGTSHNNDKIGVVVIYLDKVENRIIHLQSQIFYDFNEEEGSYKKAQSFIKDVGYSSYLKSGEFEAYLAKLYESNSVGTSNNKDSDMMVASSAQKVCGLVGVVVCAQHCGIWGLACGPGGGICATICGLVCGTVFVFTC